MKQTTIHLRVQHTNMSLRPIGEFLEENLALILTPMIKKSSPKLLNQFRYFNWRHALNSDDCLCGVVFFASALMGVELLTVYELGL